MVKNTLIILSVAAVALALGLGFPATNLWSQITGSPAPQLTRPGPAGYAGGCGGSTCSVAYGTNRAASCCSTGGPAGANAAGPQNKIDYIKTELYKYYSKKLNDPNITVEAQDFGCHMEASILKDGKPIKRLSISGGQVSEIG